MKHSPAFLALVNETMPRIRETTAEEVVARMRNNEKFLLIDVREDHEWQAGHIDGAAHMGRGIIERDIEAKAPDKNMAMVLYCGGGYRSALVADSLQRMGYTNVWSLAGGWRNWCERGFPRT